MLNALRNFWFVRKLRVQLIILALAGGTAGLIAGLWLTASQASTIGAAVVALCSGSLTRKETAITERRSHSQQVASDLITDERGKLPQLRDITNPILIGVHPSIRSDVPTVDQSALPTYIPRDIDESLREALIQNKFTLLIGDSAAGKSRAGFEVALTAVPDTTFLCPRHPGGIDSVIRSLQVGKSYLVWLDDIERFLGPDGLTSAKLAQMIDRSGYRVKVIATMRSHEYDRFGDHVESSIDSDYGSWRDSRDAIRRAVKIRVNRMWSPTELSRAAPHRTDTRINRALTVAQRFGVAEVLAAGPQLVEAWHNACAPGVQPRGAAIVRAAVDVRRSGVHGAIPRQLLEDIHQNYLAKFGGDTLRPDPFDEGLSWALRPFSHSSVSMLTSAPGNTFMAFDYLVDALPHELIPDHTWNMTVQGVRPRQALDMGFIALLEARHDRAHTAFTIAAQAGILAAEAAQATVLGKNGKVSQAVTELRPIYDRRLTEFGERNPDTLDAHAHLAYWTLKSGDTTEAIRLLRSLFALRREILGHDHPDTLDTELRLANAIGHAGDPTTAAQDCRRLHPRYVAVLGADHIETLDVEARIASWTGRSGNYEQALALSTAVLRRRVEILGPEHADTLFTRGRIINWLAAVGRYREAYDEAAKLHADRERTLGSDHPHTLHTRRQIARLTARVKDAEKAHSVYASAVVDHVRVFGEGHPITQKLMSRARELQA